MLKGNNTAMVNMGNENVLFYADKIRNRFEDVYIEEPKVDDGSSLPEGDRLEENIAESDMQYYESSEDEIRQHSP